MLSLLLRRLVVGGLVVSSRTLGRSTDYCNLRNDEARYECDSGGRPTITLIEHNTVAFTPST